MSSPPPSVEVSALVEELSGLTLPLMWTMRQDAMRAFEPLGIRPVKALLLRLIEHDLRHPKELAELLDTVPPTISAMLAELEAQGLLERSTDPKDRRRVQLGLTEAGREVCAQLASAWHEVGTERLSRLSPDELRSLIRIYHKILYT